MTGGAPTLLPPYTRGLSSLEFTLCALRGEVKLQFDTTTSVAQYPPREVGARSLSPSLEWRDASPRAVVLASSVLRASGSAYVREHLPWPIVLVETEDGARIVAHALDALAADEPATLSLRLDRAGRGMFCAVASAGGSGSSSGRGADPADGAAVAHDGAPNGAATPHSDAPDYAAIAAEFLPSASGAVLRLVGDDTRGARARIIEAAVAGGAARVLLDREHFEELSPELRELPGVAADDTGSGWLLRVDFV